MHVVTPRRALAAAAALLTLTAFSPVMAAPVITEVFSASEGPASGPVGQPVVIMATGLGNPVRVFFSNGTSPNVEATDVEADLDRGLIIARIPSGAVSGDMKIKASGNNSGLFHFRVDSSTFTQGTSVVGGQVTGTGGPVANAMVVLVDGNGCEDVPWDFTLTDGSGNYSLTGRNGDSSVMVFPPVSTGLSPGGGGVTLSAIPSTLNIALMAGTTVTGRVVDAASPTTGIRDARIEFEGEGVEFALTDNNGDFSLQLPPGDWEYLLEAPASEDFRSLEGQVTVGTTSPQSMGDLPLLTGVKISGFVTRASDGTPLPGAEVTIFPEGSCCSGNTDDKIAGGDGSYALFVPANDTYELKVRLGDSSDLVDAQVDDLSIGTTDVSLNVQVQTAAIIEGTINVFGTSTAIDGVKVGAYELPLTGWTTLDTRTCRDGSYRLRVTPDAAGYVVSAGGPDDGDTPYARLWTAASGRTYYSCEAAAVSAASAGATTSGIDFDLPVGANIEGRLQTQASGCSSDLPDSSNIVIDNGSDHGCGVGGLDYDFPGPGFRFHEVPPSTVVPSLRACVTYSGYDPQCFNLKTPPAFDPIVVAPGGTATGIDFCLADCTPVTWYADVDGDTYGDPSATQDNCEQPAGSWVADSSDCDDNDAAVNPGADEICANGIDDDCDTLVDEAGCTSICFDNDFDDYADCTGGCTLQSGDACGECDDTDPAINPAATDTTCNNVDENCDASIDEGYVSQSTSCGVGACEASGSTSCVAGTVVDDCTPGTPAPDDSVCNGVDDDCDGGSDEDYVSQPTACGVGACASAGTTSCVAGSVSDSCTPGTPTSEVCDGVDNDCDGDTDEPCSLLIAPADLTVFSQSDPPQTFSWTAGEAVKYRIEFATSDSPWVTAMKGTRKFKPDTTWTPNNKKWKKLKKLGANGATVYWRVVGKLADKSKVNSETRSFTFAP